MPQTRFVPLTKLQQDSLIVKNKVDRPGARAEWSSTRRS
jgi:predicted membrane GTPase involved in stress response